MKINNETVLHHSLNTLRHMWEETSFELEKLQSNVKTAEQEQKFLNNCEKLPWKLCRSENMSRKCSQVSSTESDFGRMDIRGDIIVNIINN
jgi:hypothetical protein